MKPEVILSDKTFTTAEKEAMWAIYSRYYNYSKAYFMERLEQISYFAIYRCAGKLIGFTGLKVDKIRQGLRTNLMIYFGQTVIDQDYRGNSLLPLTGAALCKKYWNYLITGKVFFWCDALTYKPYLVFAKTLDCFYPSRKEVMPEPILDLRNHLGRLHYGNDFCNQTGVVTKSSKLVDDPSVVVYPDDLKDPDIKYYVNLNPKHLYGNGLLTLAPVSFRNLCMILSRALNKFMGRKNGKSNRAVNGSRPETISGHAAFRPTAAQTN